MNISRNHTRNERNLFFKPVDRSALTEPASKSIIHKKKCPSGYTIAVPESTSPLFPCYVVIYTFLYKDMRLVITS